MISQYILKFDINLSYSVIFKYSDNVDNFIIYFDIFILFLIMKEIKNEILYFSFIQKKLERPVFNFPNISKKRNCYFFIKLPLL